MTPAEGAVEAGRFLAAAERIGMRVVQTAMWDGRQCTWTVMVPDHSRPLARIATGEVAGPALYQGTAGIALFLTELGRVTEISEVRAAAVGGVLNAVRGAAAMDRSKLGLHSGRVGVAWVAVRAGLTMQRDDLVAAGRNLLTSIDGAEATDRTYDVIGGAAGAIPALLQLSAWLEDQSLVDAAIRLGRHLVRHARLEPIGWSWGGSGSAAVRNLNGYAHGASGIGHAFVELYQHTGMAEFRYGAEQAFAYERQFFSLDRENWPDLRNIELSRFGYEGRMEELVALLRRGEAPPVYKLAYMNAWCHGAPGIGLARLRALQVLSDPIYEVESSAAVRSTVRSLLTETCGNYSLCHGVLGNCETLAYAAGVLGDPALRGLAEEHASAGVERFGDGQVSWPCGTAKGVSDPSLLLGEAGIGYGLLRLHEPSVPSVLLVQSPKAARPEETNAGAALALRRRRVTAYLGRSLKAMERVTGTTLSVDDLDLAEGVGVVQRAIAATRDPTRRGLLEEVNALDMAYYEMICAITDFTESRVRQLRRAEVVPDGTDARELVLAPEVRWITLTHDWEAWLDADQAHTYAPPEPKRTRYLAFRTPENGVAIRKLTSFAEACLRCFRVPTSTAEAVRYVRGSAEVSEVSSVEVASAVVAQVRQAYRAGILQDAAFLASAAK